MRKVLTSLLGSLVFGVILSLFLIGSAAAVDCDVCHSAKVTAWQGGHHANTQADVADELAAEWAGLPPDSVINGSGAEDCLACHGPTAVNANGGMTEVEAMGFFFTTIGGVYTASTVADSTSLWPQDSCSTCHNVPTDHQTTYFATLSIFNSTTAQYDSVANTSVLCGQCHGALRFAGTDHRLYDAWKTSNHGHQTQIDVADELAAEWAGVSPDSVINGSGAEDCIACHGPTATKANGGIDEAQALSLFFTTTGGVFTAGTTVADSANWPYVSCIGCHDPHNPDTVSYFNSTTRSYEVMSSSDSLCGQCHGTLRFPDTDHMSYNIELGTGGVGVPDSIMMVGTKCVDCHMANDGVDGSASTLNEGHSWSVFIPKTGTGGYAACGNAGCHTFSADSSRALVESWQTTYQQLLANAQGLVADAETTLQGSSDSAMLADLAEAQANLAFAESDESGGAHNADYVQMLLNDAISKANLIVLDVNDDQSQLPEDYALRQNYPNPFNPTTSIEFILPRAASVRLELFNLLGQHVRMLVDERMTLGNKVVVWNGTNDTGDPVASGVYFYRLTANDFTATKRMILMK